MKQIPNILTGMRIVFAMLLVFTRALSLEFYIIYSLCGLTDVLDGYTARKMNSVSSLGATFDSIADFIFFGIILMLLLPIISFSWWILFWITAIALIRLVSLAVGYVKYKDLSFLHTYANKAAGAVLFLFPFLYSIYGQDISAAVVCSTATISAIEELIITLTEKELQKDRRCFFMK
ncbi:CDP-alcohol phosphatidyltransferase family protein [Aminipila sp.]|uniref:CDP-alcohol phosphatidyltransferase family protein n=1 Tax=Aminipila sp. TaxID=2060095 RepID=UPI0028A12B3B|nr:CDP-alcohol phosphatidyltransferase family protein [Aminipila sp.]